MTMTSSVLSTYLKPYSFDIAMGMWIVSMVVHLGFMAYFTKHYILKFDVKKCLPCYFVVYVGFAVNSFIAPVYGYMLFAQALFWFGLASLLILLPVLMYRVIVIKGLPLPPFPTIMIFAAPTNVCLNAYLKSYSSPNELMIWFLLVMTFVLYFWCLALLPKILMMMVFYPAYLSMTFPLAISGIATTAAYNYFKSAGNDMPFLQYLAGFEVTVAVVFVVHVLVGTSTTSS